MMKKSFLVVLSLVFSAMIAVIIIGSMTVKSQAKSDDENKVKYYECIQVEAGDSLWTISERYASHYGVTTKDYVKELMRLNCMESDFLVAGGNILVVYYE